MFKDGYLHLLQDLVKTMGTERVRKPTAIGPIVESYRMVSL